MISHRVKYYPVCIMLAAILAGVYRNSHTEELGRLFTTPEERSKLDNLRNLPSSVIISAQPEDLHDVFEKKSGTESSTVAGLVYRKSGRSTVWINTAHVPASTVERQQLPVHADEAADGVVLIKIPEYGVSIKLRKEYMRYPQTEK